MRETALSVQETLSDIYSGDLPEALALLLPEGNIRPFTEGDFLEKIEELIEDKEVQADEFQGHLNQHLSQLNSQLEQNVAEVNRLNTVFAPYVRYSIDRIAEENRALLSIIFKDETTITSLKAFSRTVHCWNRTLLIYHQIISSESPEDINIVEVQNGSIDFVINLNFDVAINLVDLFKVGFHSYLAYLTYKNLVKPIVATFGQNQKLIDGEVEREQDLLDNIETQVANKMLEQHEIAKEDDEE